MKKRRPGDVFETMCFMHVYDNSQLQGESLAPLQKASPVMLICRNTFSAFVITDDTVGWCVLDWLKQFE